jgi:hypothetical protein
MSLSQRESRRCVESETGDGPWTRETTGRQQLRAFVGIEISSALNVPNMTTFAVPFLHDVRHLLHVNGGGLPRIA